MRWHSGGRGGGVLAYNEWGKVVVLDSKREKVEVTRLIWEGEEWYWLGFCDIVRDKFVRAPITGNSIFFMTGVPSVQNGQGFVLAGDKRSCFAVKDFKCNRG
ncbi:hypothetical protein CDAR_443491 [Caerostris darwini]|uniref:Uncharacterized protein n=1 Tax=Caerostris darwini TaxID=1538125 RepID=A0AAV4R8D3_9ARAC|nr:hypothetical protein CDAR_443491 [Caerostris darwini]